MKASDNEEPAGNYNLGVLYLKGIGVERDFQKAVHFFILAANAGQAKALYQLAKMFHTGYGLKKNLVMVIIRNYSLFTLQIHINLLLFCYNIFESSVTDK